MPCRSGAAWSAWLDLLDEIALLRRAMQLALNAAVGRAWRRWTDMAEERARLRDVATRVMRRMLNRLAASVFDACTLARPILHPLHPPCRALPTAFPPRRPLPLDAGHERIREDIDDRERKLRGAVIYLRMRF